MSSHTDPEVAQVEGAGGEEEDTGAQIAPIIHLEAVAVTTGEEDEDALLDLKAKLYRFDKEGNQWKERGAGTIKLLKHKVSRKVRLVMRQSKTLKICANHLISPAISIQEHAGNEKSCVWHATDFSDGELKDELFCLRFATIENCKIFKNMVEAVAHQQEAEAVADETNEDTTAAELIEKLTVNESTKETASKTDDVLAASEEKVDAKETVLPASSEEKEVEKKEESKKEDN